MKRHITNFTALFLFVSLHAAEPSKTPPDLTQDNTVE